MAGAGEGRAQLRFQDQPREPRLGSPEGISLEWRRGWACGPLVEAAEEAFGPSDAAGRAHFSRARLHARSIDST